MPVAPSLSRLAYLYVAERAAAGELCPDVTAPVTRRTLLRFATHAGVPAHQLDRRHVERFLAGCPAAATTKRNRFSTISVFCRGHVCLSSTSVYLPFSDAKRLRTVMDGRWYGPGEEAATG